MAELPKISLERILAQRHGDHETASQANKRREYQREYMRKWRKPVVASELQEDA